MFRCPHCGASARTRTSRAENDTGTVRKKYYQCNNLECGLGFTTLEAFNKYTSRHAPVAQDTEAVPWGNFPESHRGNRQMNLPLREE
ncbi:ogr/Delta-like zinc finger family protein [Escherichia coli]|nr:ogr/Delta-like zinc finger family protein [Escherichia coli]EJB8796030.1 ogr/Delta-like zinc finger family protein [Escherichia coli]EKG5179112.1 ogr/Delta-like zinc finger family protein [Escherichia coli]